MLKRSYSLAATLLVVHEIDSAFWREWNLFGLPGGISLFLAIHVVMVLALLWGHERVLLGDRVGTWMSVLLGLSGVATTLIHGSYLLSGSDAFRTPASLSVLGSMLVVSVVLLGTAFFGTDAPLRAGGEAIAERAVSTASRS